MNFNYETHSLKSGIYKILNTHTNRIYIGQAKRFKERWMSHKRSLLNDKHQNKFLLSDFKKCRTKFEHDDFLEFHVIEVMEGSTKEERNKREEEWIATVFDHGKDCYNLTAKAVSREGHPSKNPEKTRRKLRQHGLTNEGVKKGQFKKGDMPWSFGRPSVMYGKTHSDASKELIRAHRLGKKHSDETKKKIKQSLQRKPTPLSFIANHGRTGSNHPMFGKHHSDEAKQKMAEANKGNSHRRKTYDGFILVAPSGEKFVKIDYLIGFCKEHSLEPANLRSVLNGKRQHHKGWKIDKCLEH